MVQYILVLNDVKNNSQRINNIFIIKGFRTIVFIFIVISTTFRSICPPVFFWCLLNSVTSTELRTTSFIESIEVACSDSVSHNRIQVLSIPVLLLAYSQDWNCNLQIVVSLEVSGTNAFNRYAMCSEEHPKKTGGHIGRNVVEITILKELIIEKGTIVLLQSLLAWVDSPYVRLR